MDAGTKLTPDQLATLAPGDDVTIEVGAEFGRTRHRTGTVTRVTDTSVLVTVQSARGVAYVQEFSLRTALRTGRGNDGALVTAPGPDAGTDDRRGERQRVNALWRAWSRDPDDVAALRELHAAIGDRLRELEPIT